MLSVLLKKLRDASQRVLAGVPSSPQRQGLLLQWGSSWALLQALAQRGVVTCFVTAGMEEWDGAVTNDKEFVRAVDEQHLGQPEHQTLNVEGKQKGQKRERKTKQWGKHE
mmetsp:Transcript_44376/g.82417  ORF Transcript_44376/g.82417 Transcript_44376/m.82417 type:complete len:110 (-) Transcript_44376:183-512(-)|eukprot:CAMPEP_0197456088 /NCGR_PEP_ID=MMETSP1175-20131217/42471_1 /TAXON_ID=1003142 /ORGANISM="Triceratium dubium, Strain CCMP147" /LENGTH=109 /DNA_ID=CAMNT_0042990107 /DNA_START=18 /DNA_END=347 /DNA_ORIENTATION=-